MLEQMLEQHWIFDEVTDILLFIWITSHDLIIKIRQILLQPHLHAEEVNKRMKEIIIFVDPLHTTDSVEQWSYYRIEKFKSAESP